ncbi:2-oxoacid:acceptor oxidoreductase subunit alpha [Candidatus Hecatella orcuttiae]|jgi:2-oxoglutarate ferredoxin oxidoreductase subunit alpha|uniref:2-oxoacid:acceptor oxidoreductase subunit alpha n=1 Tax=Candidatus Hecatella orcuttiae TaxID=1935119 RepID=UPI0028680AD4|nr:2-oxoacid:acceptor oxidoreductase subunit alpha [Candidatus Hecatella orcuttiae]
MVEFNFRAGGAAGQGVQTVGYILAKTLARGGLYVHASQDYESRIRGGHNFFHIRVSENPIYGTSEKVDLLIALDSRTVDLHSKALTAKGVAVFDGEKTGVEAREPCFFDVPFEHLASEAAGRSMFSNTVAIGAALSLVRYDFSILRAVLTEAFQAKSRKIAEDNVRAAEAGYKYAEENFKGSLEVELKPTQRPRRMLINGAESVALGALAAGCKFMSGYPMTPSTGILQYMQSKSAVLKLVVEQAEDEIAALNMAVGASFAGVRAMTATSGGGFSLMVEAFGLAGMTETPVVVVLGQRPGPATGFPTRTEQGELEFVIHAAQGEFARAVLAPRDAEDAFYLMSKAFNIAERYQIPVVVLTDQYLADSYWTVERFDLSKITIDRGELLSEEEASKIKDYARHKLTESGISPRALPGYPRVLVVTDSDEHTEDGHITESAEVRVKMVEKRVWKTRGLEKEMTPLTYGSEKAGTVLLGWGSSYGAIREAVDRLNGEGFEVRMLHFNGLWPFPAAATMEALKGAERRIMVESNATSQLSRVIRAETGIQMTGKILRYDGRPLTASFIVEAFKREVAS